MTDRIVDFLARHAVGIYFGLGAILAFYTSGVVLFAFSVRCKPGRLPRWALFRFVLQPYRDPEEAYRRPGALLFAIMVAGAGLLFLLCIVVVE